MKLPVFQADAFTDKGFGGNPAAVCPLEHWLSDDVSPSFSNVCNPIQTRTVMIVCKNSIQWKNKFCSKGSYSKIGKLE
jgi:hypothetical protein